jgi:hypothetical protein
VQLFAFGLAASIHYLKNYGRNLTYARVYVVAYSFFAGKLSLKNVSF